MFFVDEWDDMTYDAFVSYAASDSQFVEDSLVPGETECTNSTKRMASRESPSIELVPGLENDTDGSGFKYKCMVHARDFEPGKDILKQIDYAVSKTFFPYELI